jgi:predicted enzyme related to lactoylglutathione lyase
MPLIEKHTPGSFSWIELSTTKQNACKDFYSGLFGWTAVDNPMGPEEIYTLFKLDGKDVAACYTMWADEQKMGIPSHWNLYVAVDSADDTAAKAAAAGAQILAPPFDVIELGRMAVIRDSAGAVFCIWQAKTHIGVRYAGQDNTFCWADLITSDPPRARDFYAKVFGWHISAGEKDPSGYLHIQNGEDFIGGIPPSQYNPPNVPPHWTIYFMVADVDASVQKLKSLGGAVHMAPSTMEGVGRMAIVADPAGAAFALFKSAR